MYTKLLLAVAVAAAGVTTAFAAPRAESASAIEPDALARARLIRTEVDARYRLLLGRRLSVTEATTAGVVESLTLVADPLELPRVVPATNGLYFAICSARASCPYPVRSAAWPATAFLPRRQALELALRAFRETSADLVIVALPTAEPVWAIFERDELMADEGPAVLDRLAPRPTLVDTTLEALVDRLTRPRLFLPLPVLPPPPDTLYAMRLAGAKTRMA